MYRCISELKGLVIDVDSFEDTQLSEWDKIVARFKCLFLTSNENTFNSIESLFSNSHCYLIESFKVPFSPSISIHRKVLQILQLNTTEIAYVSKNFSFINNAMNFLCGSIWLTEKPSYEEVSKSPDIICKSFKMLEDVLLTNVKGYLGEAALFPGETPKGFISIVNFEYDNNFLPLYMLGRYFGYRHYIGNFHPYSKAIYFNKKRGKPYYGIYNKIFIELYALATKRILGNYPVDSICSVPPRPEQENRFKPILQSISERYSLDNLDEHFVCKSDYPPLKTYSYIEREELVKDKYLYNGDLTGKNIILIDDVITTGNTIKSCITALKEQGAANIYIIVLAVNQLLIPYWSSNEVDITCPKCNSKMGLLVNSHNSTFFYSCRNCRNTLNFKDGIESLHDKVNSEYIEL